MKGREDYLFGMLGGSVLGIVPSINAARIFETIVLATIGAVISFFVTRLLRWCWKKR
ncbi:hypothetical protein [Paradesertivirga mongoliensis]|uniref:hypothetical protein n=1 Tax=Paradesertivirga mongoliensis TaxID=2100740 RepID=UPI002109CF34|nr:hypothetical protein [Pedobacter mongoliensis]